MNGPIFFFLFGFVGIAVGYYLPAYNVGPNDPYAVQVNPDYLQQPSAKLWFGNQGSNQVGANGGLWTTLTNKFPFLGNMFGRMQLPSDFNVPQYTVNQYPAVPSTQYGVPEYYQPQFYQAQPQFYYQQVPQKFPTGRDVAVTDDAVIVTPPQTPIFPAAPAPAQEGYRYNKPQYRLELPQK